jgi:tetratricopeptide (TPR) repeat protein
LSALGVSGPRGTIFRLNFGIWSDNQTCRRRLSVGASGLDNRYTRSEVERMIGVTRGELDYWTRLRLVLPRARWGERFFSFSDLIAIQTIKGLAARKVPANRIRRAISALETELGSARSPLSMLRISTNGKQLVVHLPKAEARPYEPLTGQFVLNFEIAELAKKVHAMASRSAEEWFELGMECDSESQTLDQAAQAYRKAVEAAPEWVEAHVNLGTTFYLLGRMEEAREEFEMASELEPDNALAEFNLGCVLEQLGHVEESIKHLQRAIELAPGMADAHLNLALAFENGGDAHNVVRHLSLYLRYDPNGPWAEFARSRISKYKNSGPASATQKITPFRRNH